ncbi:hypothetical protein GCM10025783_05480 [Amnibacterium soli]|uniref:DUF4124 domain-containing protein n=1 Tax=Amnibacterium soli TaxID=1282736 RepID=A0ABP8YT15_9MICO
MRPILLRLTAAASASAVLLALGSPALAADAGRKRTVPGTVTTLSQSKVAYPFGPSSVWRASVTRSKVAADSRRQVEHLVGSITDRYAGVAAFNAYQYNSPVYVVPRSTPKRTIAFSNCQRKSYVPSGLFGAKGQFTGVPIPAKAVPAKGTDGTLSIYSPATDQLWELWKAHRSADGTWSACWGGRIDHVSTSPGYFTGGFGVAATGLSITGGLVQYREIAKGRIDHAMSLAIPRAARYDRFVYPAQRSDGWSTDPAALPEGTRLRLDPRVKVSSLHLSRAGKVIARAAQRYGFIVTDTAGAVSVIAEDVSSSMGPKRENWATLLKGPSYSVLKGFPWSRMQVLRPEAKR